MSNVRTRTRGAVPPQTTTQDQGDDWFQSGDEGFATADKLSQGKKNFAQRFYLKVDEEAELVVLDDTPGFFIHEYEIYDQARKKMFYETVRKDTDYDPLEQLVGVDTRFKDASYVMYLTVIDLRPYTTKSGEQRYFSKKLLPVKRVQMKKFKRYLSEHGTYRGMMIRMTRDDAKGAKIGDPEFIQMISEEEIMENFGGPAIIGQDGKTVVKPENADCFAFDYRTVLAPSPVEELAKRWGAPLNPGSNLSNQQTMESKAPISRAGTSSAAKPPPLLNRGKTAPKEAATDTAEAAPATSKRTLVKKPADAPKTSAAKEETAIPHDESDDEAPWYGDDEGDEG